MNQKVFHFTVRSTYESAALVLILGRCWFPGGSAALGAVPGAIYGRWGEGECGAEHGALQEAALHHLVDGLDGYSEFRGGLLGGEESHSASAGAFSQPSQ